MSLGVPLRTVKSIAIVVVFLSAGISVSLVGPISFIGLIVPHMIRLILGNDYRMLIPLSVICGGIVVMAADLIGRVVNSPYETPLGIIFSVIGVPVFLILVRRERAL